MRANSSPTARAAALLAARPAAAPAATLPANPNGERWCEWPRRVPSLPPFRGIRQALLQIQAFQTRHA
jgi:hypothetical protein